MTKLGFSGQIFEKYSNVQFNDNPLSGGTELFHADGQRDIVELILKKKQDWHCTYNVKVLSCNRCCYGKEMSIARAERDGTRAETRFRLSLKRTKIPFKSVGASVQSTTGSRGVRISLSNAGYITFGGGVRVQATHSIRQFPLHFPSSALPCATRFRTISITQPERVYL